MTVKLEEEENKKEKMQIRILIVDDEEAVRKSLEKALLSKNYYVDIAGTSEDALKKLKERTYHIILADVRLPGMSGSDLLKYCKNNFPEIEVIIITGMPEVDSAVSTVKGGAFDYLVKPFSLEILFKTIEEALKRHSEKLKSGSLDSDIYDHEPPSGYNIVRTLGSGNMGVVLLVEKRGQYYAMKILRKTGNEERHLARVKRFLQEATILTRINHPCIVKIYDFGLPEGKDVPYIIMEYIQGKSLVHYLKEDSLDFNQKISIILQIASALELVHSHGILHRDIKPSNVLITNDFCIKILDFGTAYIPDSSLGSEKKFLGSPAYMAPENFYSTENIDRRSDIFSLGVLSYELITGIKPFEAESLAGLIELIQNSRPIEPIKLVPDIPSWIQDILAKMLAKYPEDRFQNVSEIIKSIEHYRKNSIKGKPDSTITTRILRTLLISHRVWS